jgi:hypothetical protein
VGAAAENLASCRRPGYDRVDHPARKELAEAGLDAGPDTTCWHLVHQHAIRVAGDGRPLPDPGRAGHTGAEETAPRLHPVRRGVAQRVLAC